MNRKSRPSHHDERGAITILTGLSVFALVAILALAIDVGYIYVVNRDLQRVADVAALGGVQRLVDSGSEADAQARALELIQMNGLNAADLTISIEAVDSNRLKVDIVDPHVGLFFAKVFGDGEVNVEASGTAAMAGCFADCPGVIVTPADVSGFEAPGNGDGWTPTLTHNDRIFSLNHHEGRNHEGLMCVEKTEREACAGYPKSLGIYTNDIAVMTLAEATNELWYTHQTATSFGAGCWDPVSDTSCGVVNLASLSAGTANNEKSVRGAFPVLVSGNLYLVDDNHDMHCVDPVQRQRCSGSPYPSSFKGQAGLPVDGAELAQVNDGKFVSRDVEVVGAKIYTTLDVDGADGVYVGCFDTDLLTPCSGWSGAKVIPDVGPGTARSREVYLYVQYDGALTPRAICAHDNRDTGCLDLNNGTPAAIVPALFDARFKDQNVRSELYVDGRTYFATQSNSATLCWDWASQSSCGTRFGDTSMDPNGVDSPEDYGYAWDGNCLIGLGDSGYYFTFDVNLQPCGAGPKTYELQPCNCIDGRQTWGVLEFDLPDDGSLNGILIRIEDLSGVVLLDWTDVGSIDGRVDLSTFAASPSMTLRVKPADDVYSIATRQLQIRNELTIRPTLVD